jgi:glutamate racemase
VKHPEIDERCTKKDSRSFYTTDSEEDFDNHAAIFYGAQVHARHVEL